MKNQNVFRMRTRRAAIILIVLAALCLLCLSGCAEQKAEQKEIPGSVKLRPKNILSQKSAYDDGAETFDFRNTYQLRQWPEAAYGFIEKLEIKEPTMVSQYVAEEIGMEHVTFGIYEDPQLKRAVDEADVGYNLKAKWAFEEGGDLDDYPDYKPYLRVALQPGTYYAAVYTTKESDDFTLTYSSWYCTIENDITLQEGEPAYFPGDGNEETYFRIDVDATGEIIIGATGFAGKLCLCSENKEAISEEVSVPAEPEKRQDIVFRVDQPGTYYLRLRDYPDDFTSRNTTYSKLFLNHIKYSFTTE